MANFFVEEESFRALGTLSQAKSTTAITSKHATTSVIMQACGCRAKLFEELIEIKPRKTANTTKCANRRSLLLRLYWLLTQQIGREFVGQAHRLPL